MAAIDQDKALSGAKILLAEDQPDSQFLIKQILEIAGATVVAVGDGAQAVQQAVSGPFDVILLDIDMPTLDGLSAVEFMRHRGIKSPILALSAHDLPGDVLNAHVAGFTDHLAKPIERDKLIHMITEHWSMKT